MDTLLSTMISAVTALITSLIVVYFTQCLQSKPEHEQEIKTINCNYLNPLRL